MSAAAKQGGKTRMQLTSTAFKAGESIPPQYACEGADVSPLLSWTDAPPKTKSFALIMDDPDAPSGTWVHWVLYDIPGGSRGLEEGVLKKEKLATGAKHGACWGVDSFERVGYWGPCPPPGKPHRYFFKLYALDRLLDLPSKATAAELRKGMEGHVLGEAELIGLFRR
jgi:Raf kinase inhibitor-like YbhB/YbcL family protein